MASKAKRPERLSLYGIDPRMALKKLLNAPPPDKRAKKSSRSGRKSKKQS
jgi:hypothetical protein